MRWPGALASLAALVLISAQAAAPAGAAKPEPPAELPAETWTLIDASSGDVLAGREADTAVPIASATKLMTYYLASRELRPREEVVVAPYDALPVESVVGLEAGDSLTARDLLYGLMLASGNDVAATLAVRVSGSAPDFVAEMNTAARRLGLSETSFVDPIGLDAGNVSSAADLVDLTVELREEPLFRRIVDTPRVTLRSGAEPFPLVNRNSLVLDEPFVHGVKTGTTLDAGFVLVASGGRGGVDLVSAVTGAPSEESRNAATLELLEYGFSLYERRTLVRRGERVASVPISGGQGKLALEASGSVAAVARSDQRVRIELDGLESVAAPVVEGDPVGMAIVRLDDRSVGEVEVLAARDVDLPPDPGLDGSLPGWAVLLLAGAGIAAIGLGAAAIVLRRRSPR